MSEIEYHPDRPIVHFGNTETVAFYQPEPPLLTPK